MIRVENFNLITESELTWITVYINHIKNFKWCQRMWGNVSSTDRSGINVSIKQCHIWCDLYVDVVPEIMDFKLEVEEFMKEHKIEPFSPDYYSNNFYKDSRYFELTRKLQHHGI